MIPLNHNGLVNSSECEWRGTPDCPVLSTDPRTYDVPRALRMPLDRPSQVMGVTDANRYAPRDYHAGANYRGFPHNALITYYIDPRIAGPFYSPNFCNADQIEYENYTDPMGSWKPHFELIQTNQVSPLSWINDSTFFRQDLMSKQMSTMNQNRYESLL